MDPTAIATIIVAVIASGAAYLAQRASSKANTKLAQIEADAKRGTHEVSARVDMERDAYIRARNFDLQTIARQEDELKELRKRVEELEEETTSLRAQLRERGNK